MRFWPVMLAVAQKDLRLELRGREVVPALAQFVVLALLIANFGFDLSASNPVIITPGVLWLVVVFAGLVAFGRTYAQEREQGSLEAMLLTPAGAVAIFCGKALAATVILLAVEAVLLPGLMVFLGAPVSWSVVGLVVLATIGMSALGSLSAALSAQTRAREVLLPVLALPLWVPFVVVGGYAVQLAMSGASIGWQPPVNLLVLDILFVVVASLAARFVLDD